MKLIFCAALVALLSGCVAYHPHNGYRENYNHSGYYDRDGHYHNYDRDHDRYRYRGY